MQFDRKSLVLGGALMLLAAVIGIQTVSYQREREIYQTQIKQMVDSLQTLRFELLAAEQDLDFEKAQWDSVTGRWERP